MLTADQIEKGNLPRTEGWWRGAWVFPAHPTIDVGRESAANLNENRQGLKTAADIYAEQGKDFSEEFRQIAAEARLKLDLAEEFDVPVTMISLPTSNVPVEVLTPAIPDEPAPSLNGARRR